MSSGLLRLERLGSAPSPGFRCFPAGDKAGARHLIRVKNDLGAPATKDVVEAIEQLTHRCGSQYADLYRQHDGVVLFADTMSDAAGVILLPFRKWRNATSSMSKWHHAVFGPDQPTSPSSSVVAFAEIPHSGNYLAFASDGAHGAAVLYVKHDEYAPAIISGDLNSLLVRIADDPVEFLRRDIGSHVRYSDGNSDTQWVPEEYFDDI